jgi:hypothetical protein
VTKQTQQIGDHTGDKVSISSLFGLLEHLFLTHFPCRYQNQPSLTCQEPSLELEEENSTQNPPPPPPHDAYQNVRGYFIPQTRIQRIVHPKYFCSLRILHTVHQKVLCSLCIVHPLRLCLNCNPHTFPEFQNCKSFCDDLKAPSLQNLAFMQFVNALHLDSFPT